MAHVCSALTRLPACHTGRIADYFGTSISWGCGSISQPLNGPVGSCFGSTFFAFSGQHHHSRSVGTRAVSVVRKH